MEGEVEACWGPHRTKAGDTFCHARIETQDLLLINCEARAGQLIRCQVKESKVALDGQSERMLIAKQIEVVGLKPGWIAQVTAIIDKDLGLFTLNNHLLFISPIPLVEATEVSLWGHHQFKIDELGLPLGMFGEYQACIALCPCATMQVGGKCIQGMQSQLGKVILALHLRILGEKRRLRMPNSKISTRERFDSHFTSKCLLLSPHSFTCLSRLLPEDSVMDGEIQMTRTRHDCFLVGHCRVDENGTCWFSSQFGRVQLIGNSQNGLLMLQSFDLVHESIGISYMQVREIAHFESDPERSAHGRLLSDLAWVAEMGRTTLTSMADNLPKLTRLIQIEVIGKRGRADGEILWVKVSKRKLVEMKAGTAKSLSKGTLIWIDPIVGDWKPANLELPKRQMSVPSAFISVRNLLERPPFGQPLQIRGLVKRKWITSSSTPAPLSPSLFKDHGIGLPQASVLWLELLDYEDGLNSVAVKLDTIGRHPYPLVLLPGNLVELHSFRLARDQILYLEPLSDGEIICKEEKCLPVFSHEQVRDKIPLRYARELGEASDALCHLTLRLFSIDKLSLAVICRKCSTPLSGGYCFLHRNQSEGKLTSSATLRCVDYTGEVIVMLEDSVLVSQILQLPADLEQRLCLAGPLEHVGRLGYSLLEHRHAPLPYSPHRSLLEWLRKPHLYYPLWHVYGKPMGQRTLPNLTRQVFTRHGPPRLLSYQPVEAFFQACLISKANVRLEAYCKGNLVNKPRG